MAETVRITYSGTEAILVPDAGLCVEPGQTVTVSTELAASLLARPEWAKVEKKAAKGA